VAAANSTDHQGAKNGTPAASAIRAAAIDAASPASAPAPTGRRLYASSMRLTRPGDAPSASRIAISRTLEATTNANTA
jgi:hypothetical protein